MQMHEQWVTLSGSLAEVGMVVIAEPLDEIEFNDGGFAYSHPNSGTDWRADVIKVGAHVGGNQYRCLVRFRNVRAIESA